MVEVIDGKQVAASVIQTVKSATAALAADSGVTTGLAVVIVGDDPASHTYVASKSRMARECGFNSVQHTLPAETRQEELAALVASLNADPSIHGILVQLPLPKHLDSEPIIQSILPEKDVDGLNVVNAGKLATGDIETGLISCTPAGALILIRTINGDDLSGRLVPEHDGPRRQARGRGDLDVGVADARRHDPHQHLVGARLIHRDAFDWHGQRLVAQDRGAHVHP